MDLGVPSGYVKIAIEHGPVEIVDFPIKHGWIFHSYVNVYQRVICFLTNITTQSLSTEESMR